MRKIIALAVLVTLIGALSLYAEPGFRQDPGPGDILGQGKFQGDPHKIFRLVRYVPNYYTINSPTMSIDSIVIWSVTSDDGCTVTVTTNSSDSAVAGILAQYALTPDVGANGYTAVETIGHRNWSWLQTYGKCEAIANPTNPLETEGGAIGTGCLNGTIEHFIRSTTNSQKQGNAGFVYDTATVGGVDVECFIRLD